MLKTNTHTHARTHTHGPTISWSNVIPTLWRSISGRVSIVRFGDGASAFCWLAQRWLAQTDDQFSLSLVSFWLFPPAIFLFSLIWIILKFIFFIVLSFLIFIFYLVNFNLFIDFFLLSFFHFYISFYPTFILLSISPHFLPTPFLSSWTLSHLSMRSCNVYR